ncbi:J domain-containing protein [Parasediminibacterium sp. JCM 36343]|uniref:J domain-containing protein n=1 Tax=Parasediminibacterium sp. JCM 36343 TaxID=3374279 RepID=UPI00397927A3
MLASNTSNNHYQTLQVAPTATGEAIKKAYRKLALQYHPDIIGDDMLATEQFRQIKTAYETLINPQTRQKYHYKYFYTHYKTQPVVTAAFIASQAESLSAFAAVLDPYRVDTEKLQWQIQQLISGHYLQVLQQEHNLEMNKKIIASILRCTQLLPFDDATQTHQILLTLAGNDEATKAIINKQTKLLKRIGYWNRYKLLLALAIAVGLCIAMYLLV